MKSKIVSVLFLVSLLFAGSAEATSGGGGAGSGMVTSCPGNANAIQTVSLSSGWNVVSTPRVLASHSFSAAETSANFDIFVLDASQPSGWATLAQEGQAEFTPLFGYFVNNKTGVNQTLSFCYLASTTPAQRLFDRTFTKPGWYSIGVANPSYALAINAATSSAPSNQLRVLAGVPLSSIGGMVDFTAEQSADVSSHKITEPWRVRAGVDVTTLPSFRETKGYALFLSSAQSLSGSQDDGIATTSTISNLPLEAQEVFAKDSPSVVYVETMYGSGSGFFIDGNGTLVTNAHVVAGAATVSVTLKNGKTLLGSVIGRDADADLALVRVSTSTTPLALATALPSQADKAYVVGYPYGIAGADGNMSISEGIISRLLPPSTFGLTSMSATTTLLEHTAQMLPGNSGGPLVSNYGTVLGVNEFIVSDHMSGTLKYAIGAPAIASAIPALSTGRNNLGSPFSCHYDSNWKAGPPVATTTAGGMVSLGMIRCDNDSNEPLRFSKLAFKLATPSAHTDVALWDVESSSQITTATTTAVTNGSSAVAFTGSFVFPAGSSYYELRGTPLMSSTTAATATIMLSQWSTGTGVVTGGTTDRASTALDVQLPPSIPVALTSPRGGEQWVIGDTHPVTWSDPSNLNFILFPTYIYVETSDAVGQFHVVGSIDQIVLMTDGSWNVGSVRDMTTGLYTVLSPGTYYLRVVNSETGSWTRSGAITILPRPITLKVNGMDSSTSTVSVASKNVTVTWSTQGVSDCRLTGLKNTSFGIVQPTVGTSTDEFVISWNDTSFEYGTVSLDCSRTVSGVTSRVSQSVSVKHSTVSPLEPLLTINSPTGGVDVDKGSVQTISVSTRGVDRLALSLYENDRLLSVINPNITVWQDAVYTQDWLPSIAMGTSTATTSVFRIVADGHRSDGNGYVQASTTPFAISRPTVVAAPTLTVTTDVSSPSFSSLVAGGTKGVFLGSFVLHATNDALQLQKLGFAIDGNYASSSDIENITLWNGLTQIGTAIFAGSSLVATSTLATPLTLAKDADTTITVKVDVANVGTSQPGVAGHTIKIKVNGVEAIGTASGSIVPFSNSSVMSAGVTLSDPSSPAFGLD